MAAAPGSFTSSWRLISSSCTLLFTSSSSHKMHSERAPQFSPSPLPCTSQSVDPTRRSQLELLLVLSSTSVRLSSVPLLYSLLELTLTLCR